MPRPKRAARKRRLTELSVRKLKPKADDLPGLGHPAARARDPGAADRQPGLEVHLLAATAGRAGCTWATPARSGWPTPARWRRRRCWRSPGARTRRPRSGPSAAPAPSPSWPRDYVETLRQEAQQELAAGRHAGAALPAAALGQAAGGDDHPRRRPRHDGPHRGARARQPGAGGRSARSSPGRSRRRSCPPTPAAASTATRPGAASASCPTVELPQFWTAFDDAGLVASSALKMILLTGQRPGEVAHMRREHIVDGWWEMPGEPVPALGWPGTKNGESHRVWLPQAGAGHPGGAGRRRDHRLRVRRASAAARSTELDGAMRDICKKLGVERATPHDLRRTHGSTITALGFGRDAMNRIQNHKEGGIACGLRSARICRREQAHHGGGGGQDHGAGRGASRTSKVVPIRR